MQADLGWLVAPLTIDEFVDNWWQQKPIHLTTGRGSFPWFDSRQLEQLIEVAQPQPPSIRLAAQGRDPLEVPFLPNGRLDLGAIRNAFLDGYTIIVNNVQRFHSGLQSLVQGLQEQSSYPVEANTYFTPPGAQGFHPHYDSHHVFVVQVEGSKRWKVYGEEAAREARQFVDGNPYDRGDLPEPEVLTLHAGDVLYIPWGWVHEAETLADSSSLHVTLGVHVQTGRDLLDAALDAMTTNDPHFLRALPFGFLRSDGLDHLGSVFHDLVKRLEDAAPVDTAKAYLVDQQIRHTMPTGPVGLFDLAKRLSDISPESVVERFTYVPTRIVDCGETIAVQYLSRVLELPARFHPAMEFVLSQQHFCIGSLPELCADDGRALVTQLIGDGLLQLKGPKLAEAAV